jgi:hypothetical protein
MGLAGSCCSPMFGSDCTDLLGVFVGVGYSSMRAYRRRCGRQWVIASFIPARHRVTGRGKCLAGVIGLFGNQAAVIHLFSLEGSCTYLDIERLAAKFHGRLQVAHRTPCAAALSSTILYVCRRSAHVRSPCSLTIPGSLLTAGPMPTEDKQSSKGGIAGGKELKRR